MSKLLELAHAIVYEWQQRYETASLLDRLRKDQRTLDDIGFGYDWLATEIRRGQHDRSPLRKALQRPRKAAPTPSRRAAHDFW
jgi:hypothetical protein